MLKCLVGSRERDVEVADSDGHDGHEVPLDMIQDPMPEVVEVQGVHRTERIIGDLDPIVRSRIDLDVGNDADDGPPLPGREGAEAIGRGLCIPDPMHRALFLDAVLPDDLLVGDESALALVFL